MGDQTSSLVVFFGDVFFGDVFREGLFCWVDLRLLLEVLDVLFRVFVTSDAFEEAVDGSAGAPIDFAAEDFFLAFLGFSVILGAFFVSFLADFCTTFSRPCVSSQERRTILKPTFDDRVVGA